MSALQVAKTALMGMVVFGNFAYAGSITLSFTGADSWTASWTAPGLSLLYTPGTPNTLQETVSFVNNNPISIVFTENSTATVDNFGFRLTMSESVANNTGGAWTGFTDTLVEGNPGIVAPGASSTHPSFAHFHTDPGFPGPTFSLVGGGNSQAMLQFGGGTLANGATWSPVGIGVHEWQVNGFQRSFTLVEQPVVPEPGTGLAVLGIAALVGFRRLLHLR